MPVLKFCYVQCFADFAHQVTTYPRIFETSYDPVEMIWNTNDERVKAKYFLNSLQSVSYLEVICNLGSTRGISILGEVRNVDI